MTGRSAQDARGRGAATARTLFGIALLLGTLLSGSPAAAKRATRWIAEAPAAVVAVDAVAMTVGDMDRAVAFYSNVLTFEKILDVEIEGDGFERLVGVFGNNDGSALRARLPEVARFELEGLRFGVVHETGPATGRELRADAAYAGPGDGRPELDVLVFGHSHIPWDTITPRGIRLLNPGSPTDRRRQPVCTMMTVVADAGELRDVVLVPVER